MVKKEQQGFQGVHAAVGLEDARQPYAIQTFGDCSENKMDRALMGKKVRFRQKRHGVIGFSEERMELELPGEPSETNSCLIPR